VSPSISSSSVSLVGKIEIPRTRMGFYYVTYTRQALSDTRIFLIGLFLVLSGITFCIFSPFFAISCDMVAKSKIRLVHWFHFLFYFCCSAPSGKKIPTNFDSKVQYLEDFLLWFPDLHRLHTGTISQKYVRKKDESVFEFGHQIIYFVEKFVVKKFFS